MFDYDVIFIGSGHACNHGAMTLKMAGKKVAFVEKDKIGGTCTNYGCDAKILLDGPFDIKESWQRYADLCLSGDTSIDWKSLMAYKKSLIGAFDPMLGGLFTKFGIDIIRGHGKLKDAHTVSVDGKDITAEYIVLGVGQRDVIHDIPGKEYVHGSRDFLDVDAFPDRIVFIGAGIISLEFASMAIMLKKQVTVIHHSDRPLRAYPKTYVDAVIKKMSAQGVNFIYNDSLVKVSKNADGYIAHTKNGKQIGCDYVLEATGRAVNLENLGLDEVGIAYTKKGISVDDHLRSSVPNIYISGDAIDKTIPKLTPTAEFESNYIADQILGIDTEVIQYPVVPNLVFTLPRIGQVGVTIDQAQSTPDTYTVIPIEWGKINEWVDNRETDCHVTFILDKEKYLVGAAIYGSQAGMWLDFITLIINQKLRAKELRKMIFAFPTQTYSLLMSLIPLLR